MLDARGRRGKPGEVDAAFAFQPHHLFLRDHSHGTGGATSERRCQNLGDGDDERNHDDRLERDAEGGAAVRAEALGAGIDDVVRFATVPEDAAGAFGFPA